MRERKAFRRSGLDPHSEPHGYVTVVDSDFSGPHEPDVDGNDQAYVGVEMEHGYGYVGLQESRSSRQTLDSMLSFESELKQVSRDVGSGIVAHHDDDDKSFRGEVERYGLEHGLKDTTTGGYRPNANSTCERAQNRHVASDV